MSAMNNDPVAEMVAGTRSRVVGAGIDPYEYAAVTDRMTQLDDWPGAFRAAAQRHLEAAKTAQEAGRRQTARESYRLAGAWFYFAGATASAQVGTFREAADAQWASLQLGDEGERVARVRGQRFAGFLRVPAGHGGSGPLVVLVPGLDGAKDEYQSLTEEFVSRGVATLAIDGPGQGELVGVQPPTSDYAAVVTEAIDRASSGADVDWTPSAVGIMGLSLGAHYTLRALAQVERLVAGVVVSGFAKVGWEAIAPLPRRLLLRRTDNEQSAVDFANTLDVSQLVPSITAPLMVVDGGQDPLVHGDFTGEWIAKSVQDGRRRFIEEGDHNVANARWLWLPDAIDWLTGHLTEAAVSA